jgi:hypothetical protein
MQDYTSLVLALVSSPPSHSALSHLSPCYMNVKQFPLYLKEGAPLWLLRV